MLIASLMVKWFITLAKRVQSGAELVMEIQLRAAMSTSDSMMAS
jgi:hypothetical protein